MPKEALDRLKGLRGPASGFIEVEHRLPIVEELDTSRLEAGCDEPASCGKRAEFDLIQGCLRCV
jgi:hypothetical protein